MKSIRTNVFTSEWKLVAAFALAAGVVFSSTGTSLTLGHAGRFLAIVPVLAAATFIYRYWRPAPIVANLVSMTLKIFLILVLGMLISFGAAALGGAFPYRDIWLQSADATLGFDWSAYVDFIARHPFLAAALNFAYASLQPQFLLVGIVLALAGQRERLTIYTLALGLTLAVTILIFVFMPARAHGGGSWIQTLDYMRSTGRHAISFDNLNGIITFPSYHTQSACLFIWACWRTPYLRWPVLGLNLALILSTPVNGVHYAVDVLAGMLIAVTAIYLLTRKPSSRLPLASAAQPMVTSGKARAASGSRA